MSWQAKLKKQVGSLANDEVTDLRFNSLKLNKLPEEFTSELTKFNALERLQLNQCEIRQTDNLPCIPSLKHLEMLDNYTTAKTIKNIVQKFKNLESLILGGNYLRDLSDLDDLASLNKLKVLNIMNGINKPDHVIRAYAFQTIPSLRVLDDRDINGNIPKQLAELNEQTEPNQIEEEDDDSDLSAYCSDDDEEEESEMESEEDSAYEDEDLGDFLVKKVKE